MGGRREVSIIFYRPVTRSDLKQERSFFRGSVSSFLQLVVEMDPKGNPYLNKTAFLCQNDIIKRLVSGKYHLVESTPIGKSLNVSHIGRNQQRALYVL